MTVRRPRKPTRLGLYALEDRTTPTIYTWTGADAKTNLNFSNDNNWDTHQHPPAAPPVIDSKGTLDPTMIVFPESAVQSGTVTNDLPGDVAFNAISFQGDYNVQLTNGSNTVTLLDAASIRFQLTTSFSKSNVTLSVPGGSMLMAAGDVAVAGNNVTLVGGGELFTKSLSGNGDITLDGGTKAKNKTSVGISHGTVKAGSFSVANNISSDTDPSSTVFQVGGGVGLQGDAVLEIAAPDGPGPIPASINLAGGVVLAYDGLLDVVGASAEVRRLTGAGGVRIGPGLELNLKDGTDPSYLGGSVDGEGQLTLDGGYLQLEGEVRLSGATAGVTVKSGWLDLTSSATSTAEGFSTHLTVGGFGSPSARVSIDGDLRNADLVPVVGAGGTLSVASGQTVTFGGLAGDAFGQFGTVEIQGATLVFDGKHDSTYDGPITGSGMITRRGGGTTTLGGSVDAKVLTVESGGLVFNGTATGTATTVGSGDGPATLSGTGKLNDVTLNNLGTIDPGPPDGTGIMTVGSFTADGDGTLRLQLNGGGKADQLVTGGPVVLGSSSTTGGRLQVTAGSDFDLVIGDSIAVIDNSPGQSVTGTFNDLPEGAVFYDTTRTAAFRITYAGGPDGNDVILTRVPLLTTQVARAGDQPAASNASLLHFDIIFSQRIPTTAFDPTGLAITATPGLGTPVVSRVIVLDANAAGTATVFRIDVAGLAGTGTVTVGVPEGLTATAAGLPNLASPAAAGVALDTVAPTASIMATAANPTALSPIPVHITFSEPVTGNFPAAFVVSNATITNFVAASASVYTLDLVPTAAGPVTLTVPANAATDGTGNPSALATFAITYDPLSPPPPPPPVLPTNTPPTISDVPGQIVTAGTTIGPLAFAVGDAETPASLSVSATSSNPALVPAGAVVVAGSGGHRTVTVTPTGGQTGTTTITLTVTDADGATAADTFTVTVNPPPPPPPPPGANHVLVGYPQFAVGTQSPGANQVALYNSDHSPAGSVTPFPGFTGGVRTAAADFNNDGVADIVAGTGPGRSTSVRVYDGRTRQLIFEVAPFEAAFTGGVFVAAGDVTGDGVPELIITPDEGGGPRVRVLNGIGFGVIADFFGIDDPNFRGGARASVGDLSGDGTGDLVVVAGFGGGPRVAGFDGRSLSSGTPVKVFADFFAFEQGLRNGVFVAVGDVDGDGFADLIAGGGPGGGPRVLALSGQSLRSNQYQTLANFFAGDADNRGGVRVSVKDLDGDTKADLVVGAGTGAGTRVTGYLGTNLAAAAFDFDGLPGDNSGVFVG